MRDCDEPLSPDDFDTLRALEESLWIAQTRFDRELMERLFAPDFFEFGRSGRVYSRAEMLFDPSEARPIRATIPLPHFHARHLSADVVQVTYLSEVVRGDRVERGNRSSIWSREGGKGWRLRFHQGTPA